MRPPQTCPLCEREFVNDGLQERVYCRPVCQQRARALRRLGKPAVDPGYPGPKLVREQICPLCLRAFLNPGAPNRIYCNGDCRERAFELRRRGQDPVEPGYVRKHDPLAGAEKPCSLCLRTFLDNPVGRPRKFCRRACRDRAYELRRQGLPEVDPGYDPGAGALEQLERRARALLGDATRAQRWDEAHALEAASDQLREARRLRQHPPTATREAS